MFVALNVILFIISLVVRFTVWELEMGSCFMWLSAGMLLVSLAELLIVQRKAGVGNHLKWILGSVLSSPPRSPLRPSAPWEA